MEIFSLPLSVHLILIENEKILLLKRQNTGFADGMFSLPAGKLEKNESAIDAMIREAKEEINIDIKYQDIEVRQVMNRKGNDRERIDYFFTIKKYNGKINNNEPKKCEFLEWFDIDKLPQNTIPYIKYALEEYKKDIKFTFFGWWGKK